MPVTKYEQIMKEFYAQQTEMDIEFRNALAMALLKYSYTNKRMWTADASILSLGFVVKAILNPSDKRYCVSPSSLFVRELKKDPVLFNQVKPFIHSYNIVCEGCNHKSYYHRMNGTCEECDCKELQPVGKEF